ncbi:DUF2334 domain-containing protein [Candidatus Marinamargulisbacteria bacterium SCGC AG-414-C22]|nr:DUF2334 domain-containing protein [Candidatus Marinamargulisbacteria bacterium SCGC AG-414-C22]
MTGLTCSTKKNSPYKFTMKKDILLSFHDVMPHNLTNVISLLKKLKHEFNIHTMTLLIVPGLPWSDKQLKTLQKLAAEGYDLAGHGWIHKTTSIKTLYHKCHSKILSRDVAEHLSLSKKDIIQLMINCFNWFKSVNLPEPKVYVPPAWAIGNFKHHDLNQVPFTTIETLSGIYHQFRFQSYPLLGYEADTCLRKYSVKTSNFCNWLISNITKRPIRLSIHPNDFELLVADQLIAHLQSHATFWNYTSYLNKKQN